MSFNTISVIGLGYIGLPTAAMFASVGKNVVGVDVSQRVVDTINVGEIHIVEPGLDVMVRKAVDQGFLKATTIPEPADAFLIAVPTPFLPMDAQYSTPRPDLSHIKAAVKSFAKVLKAGDLVILESTSPVGATEEMTNWLAEERDDLTFPHTHGDESDIRVAYCPERVLPGNVIEELVKNDRVIGGISGRCCDAAIKLYSSFVEGDCVSTNARTAEMTKLTENASRDVGIAFANELSIICDEQDINIWELVRLANRHPRVKILQPGPGVGGHCIAVDPWFIVDRAPNYSNMIKLARNINDSKPQWVIGKAKSAVADILLKNPHKSSRDITIACYGLAFKANIDDLRESPALQIAKTITEIHPGTVFLVEPNITSLPDNFQRGILIDLDKSLEQADLHLLLVDHIDFYSRHPTSGIIIDTRGIWSTERRP